MENDDGNTALNATFDTGSDQHHPQMPVHTSLLRCQSTPPWTDSQDVGNSSYQQYLLHHIDH